LRLDEEIEPYDKTLNKPYLAERMKILSGLRDFAYCRFFWKSGLTYKS
jgi:hypothetical protein